MLFSRVRAWLRQRQSHAKPPEDTVILLPKRAACFRGKLELSLPKDFRVDAQQRGQIVFTGQETGLTLTVMQLPFRRPLQSLKAIDLQIAFRRLVSPYDEPEIRHGFLRHSPTLTAVWVHGERNASFTRGNLEVTLHKKAEKTVLYLIQLRQTVFLLLFYGVTAENEAYANAVIYAASVQRALSMERNKS